MRPPFEWPRTAHDRRPLEGRPHRGLLREEARRLAPDARGGDPGDAAPRHADRVVRPPLRARRPLPRADDPGQSLPRPPARRPVARPGPPRLDLVAPGRRLTLSVLRHRHAWP